MNSGKTRPIVPVPKRANGFSIDSIIGKQVGTRSRTPSDESDQGDDSHGTSGSPMSETHPMQGFESRLPPLHPALPPYVQQLLLNDPTGRINQELLAFRSQVFAFGNQHLGAFPVLGSATGVSGMAVGQQALPGVPMYSQGLHPGFVSSPVRDPATATYPWMLARQGPSLAGLPYGPPDGGGFFFQPYRKPKRIRTAFSPSQLLRLEQAFEKNHYVVGQERKDLATKLNLTETQVKVWFQNRRTKHKRVKSDDEDGDGEPEHEQELDVDTSTDVDTCDGVHEHL